MLTRRLLISLAAASAIAAAAPPARADEPFKVVASFSILGDMLKRVGGDHVEVTTLVGPDGDAHVYEPTAADARTLAGAKLLVVNGLDFETWLPRLVAASGFAGVQAVASEGVVPREFAGAHDHEGEDAHEEEHAEGEEHDHHDHGPVDPHAWQNLANGVIYAKNIAAALAKADPAHAADYAANAAAYVAELEALDAKVKAAFAAIPAERRKVVTSHDAFGYFGAAYGIDFIAPEGVSTDAEASAADVARIIDQIRAEKITAVFVENITNAKLIEQIAKETGATIGGELYSDALSAADGPAPTYVRMFEWNVGELTKALGTS